MNQNPEGIVPAREHRAGDENLSPRVEPEEFPVASEPADDGVHLDLHACERGDRPGEGFPFRVSKRADTESVAHRTGDHLQKLFVRVQTDLLPEVCVVRRGDVGLHGFHHRLGNANRIPTERLDLGCFLIRGGDNRLRAGFTHKRLDHVPDDFRVLPPVPVLGFPGIFPEHLNQGIHPDLSGTVLFRKDVHDVRAHVVFVNHRTVTIQGDLEEIIPVAHTLDLLDENPLGKDQGEVIRARKHATGRRPGGFNLLHEEEGRGDLVPFLASHRADFNLDRIGPPATLPGIERQNLTAPESVRSLEGSGPRFLLGSDCDGPTGANERQGSDLHSFPKLTALVVAVGLGSDPEEQGFPSQGLSPRIDQKDRTPRRPALEADLSLDARIILGVDEVLNQLPKTLVRAPSGKVVSGNRKGDASH